MSTFESLIDAARNRNAKMSAEDRIAGFASPERCDVALHMRTALSALECGIRTRDWNSIAEGYCLLEDAEKRLR